ncbi:hypothetical protein SVAN01_11582 [Stagonosporopsis vannaccii]|nr:hypothetical protein SVAN01_11582 [Stagonosporopsis vannaccii]
MNRLRFMSETGKALQPGKAENTKIFAKKVWETEGQTAAHNRVDLLRKFAISPLALEHFNRVDAKDRTNPRLGKVLEVINDCPQDMDSSEDPATKYPCDIDFAVAKLESSVSQQFPRISITEVPQYPKFGPFPNLGECVLERYARVYMLLRYIGHCAIPGVWKGRYGSDDWDQPTLINQPHVPHWMRRKDAAASEPLAPDAPIVPPTLEIPERPAITLPITWKYRSKLPEAASYRSFQEENEAALPISQTIRMEPDANRDQSLNYVRALYDMGTIRGNINFEITKEGLDAVQHAL